ncbi:protein ULTRAPETALA 2 [Eucalyptus grandis]|nr:protein ULTRAPETALA 2 [Eucalyptus grandis]
MVRRKNAAPRRLNPVEMFDEPEIAQMKGHKIERDYVEVECGCTHGRLGDSCGFLRVYENGLFQINCNCNSGCQKENLTPTEFERHSDKSGNWKRHIWVTIGENKVPLEETPLMNYYDLASNEANHPTRLRFHRDEFVRCSRCKKERRFHLRSKEECRAHHDAVASKRWKCSDHPHKITCKDAEERAASKRPRGCKRSPICQGCPKCVCFGCLKCRFFDCGCRTCVDFLENVEP